ncbi:MAG: phasin family protein, partial [Myxococcales bacterium]|nr:phasin family protein [Myxococcales bacterium]
MRRDRVGAKSLEQAFEIQANYAKRAYDDYMHQMTKMGSMYTNLAKDAYKPVERAMQNGALSAASRARANETRPG